MTIRADKPIATASQPKRLLLLALSCLSIAIAPVRAQEIGALPAAPDGPIDMVLYLELVVNGRQSGHVAPVRYQNGDYVIAREDLLAAKVPLAPWGEASPPDSAIAIGTAKDVTVAYDSHNQRLSITLPPNYFPQQTIGLSDERLRYPAQTSTGLLINYDSYLNKPRHGEGYGSLWTEARLFGPFGTFSHTGTYRRALSGENKSQHGYTRYDTRWQYSDEDRIVTVEAGDLVTRSLPWGSAVRLGGVQISRNFAIRPDIVTYPLPQFFGSAALPSTVDLFVDGYKVQSDPVEAGPFSVVTTPFVNGAGQAVVVTTDALGRQVTTSLPFYVTSDLLKAGLIDYSVGLGALRQNYGNKNFDYGALALSASLRYGLTDAVTVESHVEACSSLKLAGLGVTTRLGLFGVANAAVTHSELEGKSGDQVVVGYRYNARYFNLSAQQVSRTEDYRDLSMIDEWQQPYRESSQVSFGIPLAQFGNLSGGVFSIKNHDDTRTTVSNLTWSYSSGDWGTLYLSASKSNGQSGWSGFVQWIVPLGKSGRDTASLALERDPNGRYSQRINQSRSVPSDGGIGWNLGYRHDNGSDEGALLQADLIWRNTDFQLRGGIFGQQGDETYWGGISGSLIWMDKRLFATNEVRDAFVLISTDSVADVPIRYENSVVGKTDRQGHLMVPSVPAYYAAKYEIDPLTLPPDMRISQVEQRVAVKSGGGYLLRFPLQRVVSARVKLVDETGQDLPAGGWASLCSGQVSPIGLDGLAYFEGIPAENRIRVTLPNGRFCNAAFTANTDEVGPPVRQIGPLICVME